VTAIVNRRHLLEAANAYVKARQPTPQLIASLCESVCQLLADDSGDAVKMAVHGFVIEREPRK
jgi:hypothetical protein